MSKETKRGGEKEREGRVFVCFRDETTGWKSIFNGLGFVWLVRL